MHGPLLSVAQLASFFYAQTVQGTATIQGVPSYLKDHQEDSPTDMPTNQSHLENSSSRLSS